MLTDEHEMIRKAYFDASQASGLPPQWIYDFAFNLLAAHYAETQEPVAWRVSGTYTSGLHFSHLYDEKVTAEKSAASAAMRTLTPLYTHPQPMTQTDEARERPSVVLAYSTKGHNKPCGQTIGANGCGEFVTVYYGDIDAAERSARERIYSLEKAGHRFNWAIVMRADEEAYRGLAMTFEEIERLDRAKGE